MSWWIGVEIDTGGPEPLDVADRSVTYNVGGMFRLALAIPAPGVHVERRCRCLFTAKHASNDPIEHETGLWALDGAPCTEAAGAIEAALQRMRADPEPYRAMNPPNRWGSYDTAMADLAWLLEQCRAHPKGTVYVH